MLFHGESQWVAARQHLFRSQLVEERDDFSL